MSLSRATLIATLASPPDDDGEVIRSLPPEVDWLEVRGDLVGDLEPSWLRQRFAGRLLYTLRSEAEGGRFVGSALEAGERLMAAASGGYDLVDLELERDVRRVVLEGVPARQRILSWHGAACELEDLRRCFARMAEQEAAFYKLVPAAEEEGDELAPMDLLLELGRRDVTAFCTGSLGSWTRLVAPRLGAPLVYCAWADGKGAPGQLHVERLIRDFGLPELRSCSRTYGIAGNPVAHSLSPRLHNGAYRALGLDAFYLAFEPTTFGDFWLEVVESNLFTSGPTPLDGLSVTAPFKAAALACAGASSPLANAVESANTLHRRNGVWEADTTDPDGVVGPLDRRGIPLAGLRAAVLGAGGAGRAAVAGLRRAGARVTLFNRSAERGRESAEALGVPFVPIEKLEPGEFGLVVNATSLGHRPEDELPLPVGSLATATVVLDLVYGEEPTPLVGAARERGLEAIDGREVLLHQALRQFEILTGERLPYELGAQLLGLAEAA